MTIWREVARRLAQGVCALLCTLVAMAGAAAAQGQGQGRTSVQSFVVGEWTAQGLEPTFQAELTANIRFESDGLYSSEFAIVSGGMRTLVRQDGRWSAETTPEGLISISIVVEHANDMPVRLMRTEVYEAVDDNTMRPEDDWRETSVLRRQVR